MQRVINFSPPDITDEEINEVIDALKSGWITTGPKTKKFEQLLSDYVGTKKTICLNSATAALEMALMVLGIGKGDEVIVPAYTYTASASVVAHVGAKIVMVDVEKDSYHIDVNEVEKKINENTKAIICVDIAGTPCNHDKLMEIAIKNKDKFRANNDIQKAMGRIAVIDDAAHAIGATYKGRKVGNTVDFTAFSFHAVKNLTTAEGGALTFKEIEGVDIEDIYKKINTLSLHGQTKDALAKSKLGSWEYDIVTTGYKCNMTDIMSSIGIAQLRRYDGLLKRREDIVDRYEKTIKELGLHTMQYKTSEYKSSYHLYLVRIPHIDEITRNQIIEEMAKRGIATNVHYKPLPMLTAYKSLGFDIKDYPNSYNQYKNEITFPLHTCLTDEDVEYICKNFEEIIKEKVKNEEL